MVYRPHPVALYFGVLIVLCLLPTSYAIRDSDSFRAINRHTFALFGFLKGGTIDITIKPTIDKHIDGSGVYFLICTDDEFIKFRNSAVASKEASTCENLKYGRHSICTYTHALSQKEFTLSDYVVENEGFYYLTVMNCMNGIVPTTVKYELMNPNGEQLSSEYIPLPRCFFFLLIPWSIVFILNLIYYPFNKTKIPLRTLLRFLTLAKPVSTYWVMFYWSNLSSTGMYQLWYSLANYFLMSVSQAVFFGSLILISKGWSITRTFFAPVEKRAVLMTTLALTLSIIFYRLEQGYYLFTLIIMFLVVLKFVFANIALNIRAIESQLSVITSDYEGIDPSETPTFKKLQLFNWFYYIMVFYTVSSTFGLLMMVFFFTRSTWLSIVLQEVFQLLVTIMLLWLFRVRSPSQVEFTTGTEMTAMNDVNLLSMFGLEGVLVKHPDKPLVIVVQNPPSVVGEGNYTRNVQLGTMDIPGYQPFGDEEEQGEEGDFDGISIEGEAQQEDFEYGSEGDQHHLLVNEIQETHPSQERGRGEVEENDNDDNDDDDDDDDYDDSEETTSLISSSSRS